MSARDDIPQLMTPDRLRAYPRLLVCLYALAILVWVGLSNGVLDRTGKPLGTDFISFHAAATLVLEGTPELAYDPAAHGARERAIAGKPDLSYYSFSYPPGFLLLIAPLGLLSYPAALALWMGLTLAGLIFMVRTATRERWATVALLAFPPLLLTLGHGQNAFLTTALMGGALLTLDRRPLMAGVMIGLLTVKPHLGLLWPLVLLAGGHWRTILAAGLTTILLQGASFLMFGAAVWEGFMAGGALAGRVLAEGLVGWEKMQSLYAGLRLIGLAHTPALAVHAGLALLAAAAVWTIWRRGGALGLRAAALVTATLLVTPFVLDYDLMLLAPGLLLFTLMAREEGFRPREAALLALLFVWPLLSRLVAGALGLGLTPLLLAAFLWLLWQRSREST